jgi:hypothetical protein
MKELELTEEIYNKTIYIVTILSALATGLMIEIKSRDPFNLYRKPEKTTEDTIYNIFITILFLGIIAFMDYFIAKSLL